MDDECLKEWKTLDKRSIQLIPANGKQSDNKGQTNHFVRCFSLQKLPRTSGQRL